MIHEQATRTERVTNNAEFSRHVHARRTADASAMMGKTLSITLYITLYNARYNT